MTSDLRVVAHRGFAAEHPENTISAVWAAAPHADWIEIDVRRCATGELVVFHDGTLDRLTAGTGAVSETPFELLRQLEVLDAGERIPPLVPVFEAVPADVVLNLELKDEGVAADAFDVAGEHPHDVVVSSFHASELERAREAGFDDLAYLFADEPGNALDRAVDLGCRYVHPQWRLCVDGELVTRAHGRGLEVNAWTVETEQEVAALRDAGVDGVIADLPGLA